MSAAGIVPFFRCVYPAKSLQVFQVRCFQYPNWWVAVRSTMKHRKEELERKHGLPLPKPRSIWINWNYGAELFAFGKRLHEDLPEDVLLQVFTHKDYIQAEEVKRQELGISTTHVPLNLEDNTLLILEGEEVMKNFIQKYLCCAFPRLPQEGINALEDYLLSEDLVSNVAFHLGFKDLILSPDFPPTRAKLSSTFKAVVGAIKQNKDVTRAEIFVQDFILPELIGKDVLEIWEIPNLVGYLKNTVCALGKEPETRLLREAGRNTLFAVYLVGIYVDKHLIGEGPGETLGIAEEMASSDALKRLFGLKDDTRPLPFGARMSIAKQI